ncbi:Sugar lactone lactonase YvrE [Variovorax sp. HW608]|uniref:SMP-30/gluconolactonase/LRE family protein n=1 Tax=Variovorax sp. HW608 TaxID=1034889 RepID=UPI00081F913F|nr:SMP-30/gluconolactonase/LRE family protein [Variovorax sp. HW608]SCK29094.1 Sugar lactone lactonase YvrE [Variovorax sp. HW608]
MVRIDILSPQRDLLGECPLWDERTGSLYWIDGRSQRVRRHSPSTGATAEWTAPGHIGSIALCESGRLLLALEHDFHLLDCATGALVRVGDGVVHRAERMRLNDGRTDRRGRFVVGSMTLGRHEPLGALYQLGPDGRVRTLDRGIQLANATCFSPDGRWLYFADSPTHQVRRYPYDPATGACGPAEPFIDTRSLGSPPDGATVDADGCLWVALVLAGKLACFAPDGTLLRTIDFAPDAYITCPCFGGPDLDVLYLTSIRDSGNLLRSQNPEAGAVFVVRGLGVHGLPEVRFDDRALCA